MAHPVTYQDLVARLKAEIQTARMKAALSTNVHLLVLYWKMGTAIAGQEQAEGWGSKVVTQLAIDLRSAFPDMKGISPRNLRYMRDFAVAYPQFLEQVAPKFSSGEILRDPFTKSEKNTSLQQPVAKSNEEAILQQAVAKITWSHNVVLLDRVKNTEERSFYASQAAANNWSRNVMVHQIESGLYRRKGAAVSNFKGTLSQPQSDLAHELLKDPYKFDFLNLGDEYKEKDLEAALVEHITKFLLELGAGFCYVGRQYHLEVGGEDFYIDLLFYHLKLRCFVVIELKTGKFIPEYAGKLNFYLNVVDDRLRHEHDQPSIGIIICKERNKVMAEYSLRGMNNPIGITEYQLAEALSADLRGKLPTIEEIEAELNDVEAKTYDTASE